MPSQGSAKGQRFMVERCIALLSLDLTYYMTGSGLAGAGDNGKREDENHDIATNISRFLEY